MQFASNFFAWLPAIWRLQKSAIAFAFLSEIHETYFTSLQGRSFCLWTGIGGGEIEGEAQSSSFLFSDM